MLSLALGDPVADFLLDALDQFLEAARRVSKRWRLRKLEKRLAKAVGKAFVAQGQAFARRLSARKDLLPLVEAAPVATPEPDWEAILALLDAASAEARELFTAPLEQAVAEAMLAAGQSLYTDLAPAGLSFTLENPRAVAYLDQCGAELVRHVDATTKTVIRGILARGAEQGWSVNQYAKAIVAQFREFAAPRPQGHIKNRAELVAATELGNAYEEGNLAAAEDLAGEGYEIEKYWQTVGDDRVSKLCRGNQAQGWIPLRQAFKSGHKRPLGHPA
ncbi:MAG: hypothetical protein C4551_10135 [Bacillota bacterium]|nr:MAG: hypothetical protein C4551_10135 [Bacillota bacterium]